MNPSVDASRDQLVLDQAHRAIDQQVGHLEGVRARAGNLAGYAVAVGGFLDGIALMMVDRPCGCSWEPWRS